MNRLRTAYLIEIVAAFAVALSLARHFFLLRHDGGVIVGAALTGIALVEGPAVWAERWRRRGPPVWGFGRVTWSIAGAASLGYVGLTGLTDVLREPLAGALRLLPAALREQTEYPVWRLMPWCLPALFLTYQLGGWLRDRAPDGREWGGRVYAVTIVALYFLGHEFDVIDLDSIFERWHK